jgi:hypothetical protein
MVGALLDHVPPDTASLRETPVPAHKLLEPLIAAGVAITVITFVAGVPHPVV